MRVRRCANCKKEYTSKGTNGYCPTCHAEYARKWNKANRDRVRDIQFKQKYGITLEEYNLILEGQDGVCAICKGPPSNGRFKYLSVDHDHEFGYNRGLLCGTCNIGLGQFKDSPELLRAAADYIEDWQV